MDVVETGKRVMAIYNDESLSIAERTKRIKYITNSLKTTTETIAFRSSIVKKLHTLTKSLERKQNGINRRSIAKSKLVADKI